MQILIWQSGFRKAVHPEAKFYQGDIRDRAFMDSVFENNIILTQTERLTMNSRPKKPKYARNKISTVSFTLQQVPRLGKAWRTRLSITVIIYAVPRCFWRAWWFMELTRSSFRPQRQRMESLRAFQSWKPIQLFRPTAMAKRSCPWKKCSTGPPSHTI